jgi:hypothetical protein
MKYLLAALLAFAAYPALAIQQCNTRESILSQLEKNYGEVRLMAGLAGNGNMLEVFANTTTGTWTITATRPDEITCLIGSGGRFEAIKPGIDG